MRLLAGIGGSACLTIGTGVIADMFVPAQRGTAVAVYSMGILFGPILGPVLGGFSKYTIHVVLLNDILISLNSRPTRQLAMGHVGRLHRGMYRHWWSHHLHARNLPNRPFEP